MARTLSEPDSPLRILLVFFGIGAALGLAHFLIGLMLSRYVIDPLVCGVAASAADCAASLAITDSITTILVAVGGLILAVRYGVARPLLVAATAGLFMWGLMTWTDGLPWIESLAWAMVLYAFAYALFGWINRYPIIGYAIVVSLVIVIAERIVLAL